MTTKTTRGNGKTTTDCYSVYVRSRPSDQWHGHAHRLTAKVSRLMARNLSAASSWHASQIRLDSNVIAEYVGGALTTAGERGRMAGSKQPPRANVSPRERKKLTRKDATTDAGKFGLYLQKLLDERGWDHKELAKRSKIAEPTVRKWLRGEGTPGSFDTLKALAKGLDTNDHPMPDYRLVLPPPTK